jgi:hypothetical protein
MRTSACLELWRRYTTAWLPRGSRILPAPTLNQDAGLKTPALRSNLLRLLALATLDSPALTLSSRAPKREDLPHPPPPPFTGRRHSERSVATSFRKSRLRDFPRDAKSKNLS